MATMNCEDVRNAIQSGRTPTDADLESHLGDCEACAALLGGDALVALLRDADSGSDLVTPPKLGGRFDRLKSASTPVRVAAIALTILLVGALNAFGMLRTDAGVYPLGRMALALAAFAGSAIFVAMFVLRPIHLPRPGRRLLPLVISAAILLSVGFALLPPAHHHIGTHPESFKGQDADFWPRAIACLIFGVVFGLPTLVLLRILGRGGEAHSTVVLGGLIVSALAGSVALQLHCPLISAGHLLVGHAGVPIVLMLIGLPLVFLRRRAS